MRQISDFESELVRRCLESQPAAQRELYLRYSKSLYTIAYRMLNNVQDAEEVLQDGFLTIFKSLKSWEGKSVLYHWMKTIIVRTALRKIRKTVDPFVELNLSSDVVDWGEVPIGADYLEIAIRELPDGYRAVFLLVEVEGYSYDETAKLLDVNIGTIKSQLFRAKKMLKAKISDIK